MYAKLQRGPCFIMISWSHDAAGVGGESNRLLIQLFLRT